MDTMDTMYKLTKQIDALTYNSRAVLNALVRSCIAAGSSNGYTVKRFGVELTLDRTDIFRLYDFYQSWANGSYGYEPFTSDPAEFDSIVAKCDSKWKGDGQLVTKAIVTHSKILYLVSTNKNQNGTDYWLGLVRDSSSPKLVTNSAPIPLNLRTPLYDADLSTKSFSQYETYLFPSGYNKISITGMPGDGEDHVGGGKSWLWDIDESFEVTAPRILLGYHSNPQRRLENYRNTRYSMSFGYETYALGERSVALGGLNGIAMGDNSATVGGNRPFAIGSNSMVASGYINTAVGPSSFATNYRVHAVGPFSFAANCETVTGAYTYFFTIEEPASNTTLTECEVIKDTTTGMCLTTDGSSSVLSGDGRNTVRISYSSLVADGFWDINIAKGDRVIIYAQTRKEDGRIYTGTSTEGYAFKPLYFDVVNVTRSNGDYLVQLDGTIPKGETFSSLWVNGGYISRYSMELQDISYSGTLLKSRTWRPGEASTALNYHTFTSGVNQTVVGQMNRGDRDAKFVVGIGSSYVGDKAFRRNGLVVAQGYSYMQTADKSAVIGVSNYNKTRYRDYDANFVANGAWMMHDGSGDHTGYARINDARTEIGLYKNGTPSEDSELTFVRSGSSYLSASYDVTTCLETRAGTMVICAGSYTGAAHTYDVLLQQGPLRPDTGNKGLAIYSEDGMELRNTNENYMMSFENSGYISAKFKGLFLEGNTWGALTATDEARSFWVYHNASNDYRNPYNTPGHCVDYPNTVAYSGFFYAQNDWNVGKTPSSGRVNLPSRVRGSWEIHQGRGFHIVNSAISYVNSSNESGFDVSCLLLPSLVQSGEASDPPHPKFINSFIYGTGNGGVMPAETYVAEELAYLTDVERAKPVSYASYISSSTVSKIFYRRPSDDSERFPRPTFTGGGTFTEGVVFDGTDANMAKYFGFLKDSPQVFTISKGPDDDADGVPLITAPYDHTGSITFNRYGPVVVCSLSLVFPVQVGKTYSEFLVVSTNTPALSLGTNGSIVLNGAGTDGVSVTCTISKTISTEYEILGTKCNSDNMYQFLIRNPNQVKDCTMPITLLGVIN